MTTTPNSKHFRHRLYGRLRHARKFAAFLAAEATVFGSSASAKTLTPVRTTNTKAEALITFGGQPSDADTLTVGSVTYTFKTALTEVKASGLLTFGGNPTAADTVTIDGVVYTFKTALTEAKAAGTLTNDGTNVTDADTVTIGSKVYTFQNTLTNVDGHVKIGASNTATMTNLFHAINASGGTVGTDYATLTTANLQVVATNPSGTTVVVTAITAGTAGNAIATTETSTHLSWGATTLAGGVASIANEVLRDGTTAATSRTHLVEAITAGANAGTDYSLATVVHPTVTAAAASGNMSVTAKVAGVAGNLIATTETSSNLSFGGATLTGGVASVANEIVIQDTAAHTRDAIMNAITFDAGVGSNAGSTYSLVTVAHPKVTASASSGNLLLTALLAAHLTPGMSVRLAKSAANLTLPTLAALDGPGWTSTAHGFANGAGPVLLTNSGGALPAGSPAAGTELFVHKIDANTLALATSREAMRKGDFIQTTSAGSGTHSIARSVIASGVFAQLRAKNPRTVAAATDIDTLN